MDTFTFKGVSSDSMGVVVEKMPILTKPQLRSTSIPVPGRHGNLHQSDDGYDELVLNADCFLLEDASLDAVCGWLAGYGELGLSILPGQVYRAHVFNQIPFPKVIESLGVRRFSVVFQCDPFRYSSKSTVLQVANSSFISNPGNIEAEPIITVHGNGSANLMVGLSTVLIDDLSGYITLDCEAKMARKGDTLENSKIRIMGGWPVLKVGQTAVSWTGGAASVEVVPNFRWL